MTTRFTSSAKVKVIVKAEVAIAVACHLSLFCDAKLMLFLLSAKQKANYFTFCCKKPSSFIVKTIFGVFAGCHNLSQGNHDEVTFLHAWVGQCQCRRRYLEIIVQEQVNVDGTVVVDAIFRLGGASQFPLNALSLLQALLRRKRRQHQAGRIEEGMLALEAPRLRLDKRRDALHRANAFADERNGTVQHLFPVAKVASQRQIERPPIPL